jgi:hypothetical protein
MAELTDLTATLKVKLRDPGLNINDVERWYKETHCAPTIDAAVERIMKHDDVTIRLVMNT